MDVHQWYIGKKVGDKDQIFCWNDHSARSRESILNFQCRSGKVTATRIPPENSPTFRAIALLLTPNNCCLATRNGDSEFLSFRIRDHFGHGSQHFRADRSLERCSEKIEKGAQSHSNFCENFEILNGRSQVGYRGRDEVIDAMWREIHLTHLAYIVQWRSCAFYFAWTADVDHIPFKSGSALGDYCEKGRSSRNPEQNTVCPSCESFSKRDWIFNPRFGVLSFVTCLCCPSETIEFFWDGRDILTQSNLSQFCDARTRSQKKVIVRSFHWFFQASKP
jgi:hypothetical protein